VLVYESGALVVQFRQASLFRSVRFARLDESAKADLAAKRQEHDAEFQRQKAEVVRRVGRHAAQNLAVDVLRDGDGKAAYVIFTPGVVQRTFGPGKYGESVTAPSTAVNEIALASPAGVEDDSSDPPNNARSQENTAIVRDVRSLRGVPASPSNSGRFISVPLGCL
jgi:hypothetical protein